MKEKELKQFIQQNWEEILTLLETECEYASIVIRTWIEPMKLHKIENQTLSFKVKPEQGEAAVHYISTHHLIENLKKIIRKLTQDNTIDVVVEYVPEKGVPQPKDEDDDAMSFMQMEKLRQLTKSRCNYLAFSSNNFVRNAIYSLKDDQFQMFLYLISKVKPYELIDGVEVATGEKEATFEFSVKEYCRTMRIPYENMGGQVYEKIKRDIKAIRDASWWKYQEGPRGVSMVTFSLLEKAEVFPKRGIIRYTWSQDMIPHLYDLNENFTAIEPSQVTFLDGDYAGRLYHLCCSYVYRGGFVISLEKLKYYFGIDRMKYYNDFKYIKKEILNPAVERINRCTNLDILIETDGRPVKQLYITIHEKTGEKLQRLKIEQQKKYEEYDQEEYRRNEKKNLANANSYQKKKEQQEFAQMSIADFDVDEIKKESKK